MNPFAAFGELRPVREASLHIMGAQRRAELLAAELAWGLGEDGELRCSSFK